jgi:hypothetical protein
VNLYAYVREDPTNRTDPTGDDAIVIVQANGDVQVIIPGHFFRRRSNSEKYRAIRGCS